MPAVRSCCTPARAGMTVKRETGRPSTDVDILAINDHLHALMPVGFYHKAFIKPRFSWPIFEKAIRKATGLGALPVEQAPAPKPARHLHPDTLVIGAGVAGLAAARAAAGRGDSVVLCDEHAIGEKVAPGPTRDRIEALSAEVRAEDRVRVFERAVAIGVYEGGLVPIAAPDELLQVHPGRIVVATGAVEAHAVFEGSDVPGVFLARGAARLAGVHGIVPGERAVVLATTREGIDHLATLRDSGVAIEAALVPADLAACVPDGVEVLAGATLVRARGRKQVRSVQVHTASSGERSIACDTVVVALGMSPRDGLLRMAAELPLDTAPVGAGEVIDPGCPLEEAESSGARAGRGEAGADAATPVAVLPDVPTRGYVCLCEDVRAKDLEKAFEEGFRSSQILKRYTTTTMGPCQGAMCGHLLAAFVHERTGLPAQSARTTPRPPARTVSLESFAGAAHELVEKRGALHECHLEMGAKLARSGAWFRPYNYGDWKAEYRAVRETVSIMDVSTLGKFLIGGADATALLDRVYPCRVDNLALGRSRYALMLGEAGYVFDDGLICALEDGRYYVNTTSGGASGVEAWLRDWADRWEMRVHIADQTAALGAIVVAGPRARDLLTALSSDAFDCRELPVHGAPRGRGRRHRLPRPAGRLRRRTRVRVTPPAFPQRRAVERAARRRQAHGHPTPRPRRARAAQAREGAHLHRPGHDARLYTRQARHGLGGRVQQVGLPRQARPGADGRAPHPAAPRGHRLRARVTCPGAGRAAVRRRCARRLRPRS